MNAQQILDFVVSALVKQGRPSYQIARGCLYRGPGGAKCAAGHLIPNKRYQASLEGQISFEPRVWKAIGLPAEYRRIVQALQGSHDRAATATLGDHEEWLHGFLDAARQVADCHKLSTEVVDLAEQAIGDSL